MSLNSCPFKLKTHVLKTSHKTHAFDTISLTLQRRQNFIICHSEGSSTRETFLNDKNQINANVTENDHLKYFPSDDNSSIKGIFDDDFQEYGINDVSQGNFLIILNIFNFNLKDENEEEWKGPTELIFKLQRRGDGWGEEILPTASIEHRPIKPYKRIRDRSTTPRPWQVTFFLNTNF